MIKCCVCNKECDDDHLSLKLTKVDVSTHETLVVNVAFHINCSIIQATHKLIHIIPAQ